MIHSPFQFISRVSSSWQAVIKTFQLKVSANIVRVLGSADIWETENYLEQSVSPRLPEVPA